VTRPTVRLTERRTRQVRLPREDVAYLVEHARHLIEVVPAFRRGRYRLTPREYVGWFDTPSLRFATAPKIPWPNVRMLLGLLRNDTACGAAVEPPAELLDVLAREFASLLREVTHLGLVAGYREQETAGTFLRGKLRAADQMRDAAVRAFPDRFHFTETVLDLDTPWNRVPRAIAATLLTHRDLPSATQQEIAEAVIPLDGIPFTPLTDADFAAADAEPRAAHYRELLALCRVIRDGFAAAQFPETGNGAFLIDLSRAFERYLTEMLATAIGARAGWTLEAQPRFPLGPTELQPDILLRRRGEARVVLDAKWKAPGRTPDADDLHQVLAYAAITGAKHVGLVYPGRRFARRQLAVPGTDIRVSLLRVQVVGTAEECERSVERLARFACRSRSL
jgi:5-methylcytosine-specific restriction enzyme subunit McrC